MDLIVLLGVTCSIVIIVMILTLLFNRPNTCEMSSESSCEETIAYLLSMDDVSIEEAYMLLQKHHDPNVKIGSIVKRTLQKLACCGQLNHHIADQLIKLLDQYVQHTSGKLQKSTVDQESVYFDELSILDIAYRFRREDATDEVRPLLDSKDNIKRIINTCNANILQKKSDSDPARIRSTSDPVGSSADEVRKSQSSMRESVSKNLASTDIVEVSDIETIHSEETRNCDIQILSDEEEEIRFERFIKTAIFYKRLLKNMQTIG